MDEVLHDALFRISCHVHIIFIQTIGIMFLYESLDEVDVSDPLVISTIEWSSKFLANQEYNAVQ